MQRSELDVRTVTFGPSERPTTVSKMRDILAGGTVFTDGGLFDVLNCLAATTYEKLDRFCCEHETCNLKAAERI